MATTQITAEPGVPEITITREFDAPRELLFRAHTDPALLAQRLGPRALTMTVDRLEARDGGRWRYTHRDADGNEYGFHGVYPGTPSPDGIVQTFEFEGAPGHVSLETITFEDHGGTTLLRQTAVFQSIEDRDGMLQLGMEHGVNEGMERLDELVAWTSLSPGWPQCVDAVGRAGIEREESTAPVHERGRLAIERAGVRDGLRCGGDASREQDQRDSTTC